MIEIDYTDPNSVVRSNIGDPNSVYVSDSTILSALSKYEGNTNKASILIMDTMLSYFLLQADESKTDLVEYKYTKLYERFKARLAEFKNENAAAKRIPILFTGTRLSDKNNNMKDRDSFLPIFHDQWTEMQYQERLIQDPIDV